MYLLHDSVIILRVRDKVDLNTPQANLIKVHHAYINLNKVRRASQVETTIS